MNSHDEPDWPEFDSDPEEGRSDRSGRVNRKQWWGWKISREIVELYEEEHINSQELILLSLIDRFDANGQGCWASNKYLGQRIHVNACTAGKIVTRLVEAGHLQRLMNKKGTRRILTRRK